MRRFPFGREADQEAFRMSSRIKHLSGGWRRSVLSLLLALLGLLLVGSPAVAEEIAGLAKRLAELRGEVETLSDQLSSRKDEVQEQLRSLGRQKTELELEIQREDTRVSKLRQAVAQKRSETEALKSSNQSLGPAFEKHLATVRSYVQTSLPFRSKERMAELDKIEEQFKTGLLAPQRALNRLWSFVEDELRMTRESGLFSQPVTVDGKEHLAEVVRIGMMMMYYRTPSDEFGSTTLQNGSWSFVAIEGDDSRKHVRGLFETFKKQIRVGYFELPNALPSAR
jgi:hypothetical protein